MKTGDILHCKRKSLISKLIRFFTQSEFTHTAIVVVLENETCVVEMQKNGCELKTFEAWQKNYNYEFVVSRSLLNNKPSIKRILSKSGVMGYDYELFILKYPITLVLNKIRKKDISIKRDKDEDSQMICSEFVAWCYQWDNPQNFTPKNIYDKCINENWEIIR